MDILYKAAFLFKELLDTEYVFVLGKKNIKTTIHLLFYDTNFYHLAGLQHLQDIAYLCQIIIIMLFECFLPKELFFKVAMMICSNIMFVV